MNYFNKRIPGSDPVDFPAIVLPGQLELELFTNHEEEEQPPLDFTNDLL